MNLNLFLWTQGLKNSFSVRIQSLEGNLSIQFEQLESNQTINFFLLQHLHYRLITIMTRNIDICFVHQSVYYPSYEVSKRARWEINQKNVNVQVIYCFRAPCNLTLPNNESAVLLNTHLIWMIFVISLSQKQVLA